MPTALYFATSKPRSGAIATRSTVAVPISAVWLGLPRPATSMATQRRDADERVLGRAAESPAVPGVRCPPAPRSPATRAVARPSPRSRRSAHTPIRFARAAGPAVASTGRRRRRPRNAPSRSRRSTGPKSVAELCVEIWMSVSVPRFASAATYGKIRIAAGPVGDRRRRSDRQRPGCCRSPRDQPRPSGACGARFTAHSSSGSTMTLGVPAPPS